MWIQELLSEVPNELIRFLESTVFFCVSYRRLFVPAARSKVAELDSQSFFGEILPPCGCGDFPETPWGLKLCHSNLRFTFATGTSKHQARGDKSGAFGKRIRTFRLLPFLLFAKAN